VQRLGCGERAQEAKPIAIINESAGEVPHAWKYLFLGLDLITGIFLSFSTFENHETLDGLAKIGLMTS
jgi:hypothetical protein